MKMPFNVFPLICLVAMAAWPLFPASAQLPQMPQFGPHHETASAEGARYEIIQAQTAAKWTFRLDRFTGQVWILVSNSDGTYAWQVTKVIDPPDAKSSTKPRFQLFLSGIAAKFSFLIDMDGGKTWFLFTATDNAGKEVDYNWKPFANQRVSATYDTVRQLALALPGVEEGMSYGTPSLHVRGKLMARLKEDGETVVLKVDPADRARLFDAEPDTFYTTDHYRNYPVMLVDLLSVREAALPGLVEGAWRVVAGKRLLAAWERQKAHPLSC